MTKGCKSTFDTRFLEEFLKTENLSMREFCKRCKIGHSTLKKICNGEDYKYVSLYKVARAVGVQMYELFLNEENKEKK